VVLIFFWRTCTCGPIPKVLEKDTANYTPTLTLIQRERVLTSVPYTIVFLDLGARTIYGGLGIAVHVCIPGHSSTEIDTGIVLYLS
jgi:hypothetical protein